MTSDNHGFEKIYSRHVDELNGQATLYRYKQTGTELLSIENDDENKVFAAAFRTPPPDSSGVAHILEHIVLAGSRKYPVKEPFIELVKGSLASFVNAMTYPDKTIYPVASQNQQDFYNLIDVYLDAVFHPRILPHIFEQEAWHYELNDAQDPLTFKGVVFNEMKGSMSNPDRILEQEILEEVYPDTSYAFNSGGNPRNIPDLSYEALKGFYQQLYHPSNARIYFYGDDPVEERLRIVDQYLKDFDRLDPESTIELQPRFDKTRQRTRKYMASASDDDEAKSMATVNWLLFEPNDPVRFLSAEILTEILMGTPASPLRKALIDSGLGEDVVGTGHNMGFSTDASRQLFFTAGLKGVKEENVDKVAPLVQETLESQVRDGLDPDTIAAAVNTVEFGLREMNTGSFPRGLAYVLRSMGTWLFDGDPLTLLEYEKPLQAVKDALAEHPTYFEDMIKTWFLDNPHKVELILLPDETLAAQEEAIETERLEKVRQGMDSTDLEAVMERTRELHQLQEKPDSPDDLAKLPFLQLSDLDPKIQTIPLQQVDSPAATTLYHALPTNSIVYLDLGFDLHALSEEELPWVPLLGRALLEMGTEKEDYVKLSQRIGRDTGGISAHTMTSLLQESDEATAWLFLRGKATTNKANRLLSILEDVLLMPLLDNPERFKQILLEQKARKQSGIVAAGHAVVNSVLRSAYNQADWAGEKMGGISSLFFINDLTKTLDTQWEKTLTALQEVLAKLINRRAMIVNVTVDGSDWPDFQSQLKDFLEKLPQMEVSRQEWAPDYNHANLGLTAPSQVNFVGLSHDLYQAGYTYTASSAVANRYLGTTYLWEKVRVQGGAYGGFGTFSRLSGVYSFLSYRDPNVLKTLEAYRGAGRFLKELDLSQDELSKSIIGAIGDMDTYRLPDAKGYLSMSRFLTGDSDQARQARRDQVLSTTAEDFKAWGQTLMDVSDQGRVVVLGSEEAIQKANDEKGGDWLEISKVL
ncbi:MAG: insulinase family protein [Anaerolineales bacterium]